MLKMKRFHLLLFAYIFTQNLASPSMCICSNLGEKKNKKSKKFYIQYVFSVLQRSNFLFSRLFFCPRLETCLDLLIYLALQKENIMYCIEWTGFVFRYPSYHHLTYLKWTILTTANPKKQLVCDIFSIFLIFFFDGAWFATEIPKESPNLITTDDLWGDINTHDVPLNSLRPLSEEESQSEMSYMLHWLTIISEAFLPLLPQRLGFLPGGSRPCHYSQGATCERASFPACLPLLSPAFTPSHISVAWAEWEQGRQTEKRFIPTRQRNRLHPDSCGW